LQTVSPQKRFAKPFYKSSDYDGVKNIHISAIDFQKLITASSAGDISMYIKQIEEQRESGKRLTESRADEWINL